MGYKGGTYVTVAPPRPSSRADIDIQKVTGPTGYGEDREVIGPGVNMQFPGRPQDYELCAEFYKATWDLLAAGKLKTHPTDVREGGLQRVPEGLREIKEGRVAGKKLVYRV